MKFAMAVHTNVVPAVVIPQEPAKDIAHLKEQHEAYGPKMAAIAATLTSDCKSASDHVPQELVDPFSKDPNVYELTIYCEDSDGNGSGGSLYAVTVPSEAGGAHRRRSSHR